jgi:copper ion binding protein
MAERTLHVQGMTCDACIETVEKVITDISGVERALADLDNGQVHVQYDNNQVKLDQLEQAIKNSGYEVASKTEH